MRIAALFSTALIAGAALGVQSAPAKPRNVLLIVLDDVGTDLIGAYDAHFRALGRPSSSPASTPAIDGLLAARGVTFTSCWTAPMCTPSRAQMLTGRHGFRTGVGRVLRQSPREDDFGHPGLAIEQTLLPTALHAAPTPYLCAAVGKWHLASAEQLAAHPAHPLGEPRGRWFDVYAGSLFNLQDPESGPGSPTGYWNWVKTYATALEPLSRPCGDAPLPCDVVMSAPPWSNYATVDTADDALAFAASAREPWFLYVAFNAAHAPEHDVPRNLPRARCGGYEPPKEPCAASSTPERVRCMLAEADAQIARILCAVGDEPVVFLIGDNGTAEDAVLPPFSRGHVKDTLYQGGVNVPLIVRSPETPSDLRGKTCGALVSSTDLFATIAEIAGATSAAEDSVSFLARVRERGETLRRTLYAEEFTPNFTPDPKTGAPPEGYTAQRHGQALTDGRFKLIRFTRRDPADAERAVVREELYDLLEGGPPDTSGDVPQPTPDWFEQSDLLRRELEPESAAAQAVAKLRAEIALRYACLVR